MKRPRVHQKKAGRKDPSTRDGTMADINEAIKAAHLRKFGKYTYVDRLKRSKANTKGEGDISTNHGRTA